jgi:hypothetical protein
MGRATRAARGGNLGNSRPNRSPFPRPDGQRAHATHARFARRAKVPHASRLAPSGKSQRCSRPSRLGKRDVTAASSRNVRRDAVDAAASGATISQGSLHCERGSSAQDERRCADGEVVWSWHPLLMSSRAEASSAQPGDEMPFNPSGDGGKKELVTGEITYKP